MTVTEQWTNVYSGFDRSACRDYTGLVCSDAREQLPAPAITWRCRIFGHRWRRLRDEFTGVKCEGCTRCARYGLAMFRTTGDLPE